MNANTTLRRAIWTLGAAATLGLVLAGPANARPEPGDPIGSSDTGTTRTLVNVVRVDDDALEPLQLGGGILAGLAFAGAGIALTSRRHQAGTRPHPA